MITTSAQIVTKGNAKAEIATVNHNGREFTALGSVIDHENGVVVGYE